VRSGLRGDVEAHRKYIAGLRRSLIGHFCGVDERRSQATKPICSDFSTACRTSARRNRLQPIDPAQPVGSMASVVQPVADPREPLHLDRAANRMWTARTILAVSGLAAALAGLALAWQYTSLRDFTDIGFVSSVISQPARSQFAPLLGDRRLRRRRAGGVSGAGLDRRDGSGAGAVAGFLQRRRRRAAQRPPAVFDRPRAGPGRPAAAARAPGGAGSEPHHRQGGRCGRHDPDGADRPVLDRERGGGRQQAEACAIFCSAPCSAWRRGSR
jgi:hypothetical protein